jgi:hypothetical protein
MYAKNDTSRRKIDKLRLECSGNGCRFDQLALGASRRIARIGVGRWRR